MRYTIEKNISINRIALFVLMTVPFLVFGQKSSFLDLVSGIGYSYRQIQATEEDYYTEYIIDTRKTENGKMNWGIGLNYNIETKKNMFIKTGVRITNMSNENNLGPAYFICGVGLTEDDWDHQIPDRIVRTSHWFYEIPLEFRYQFSEKRFIPFLEMGISPSVYLSTKTKTHKGSDVDILFQDESKDNEFYRFHIVGLISFGANYTISQNLQLFAQPVLRYHLTKLADSVIAERLFSVGVEMGLRKGL